MTLRTRDFSSVRLRRRSRSKVEALRGGVFDRELERRITPAALTTFQFQIPADVANLGVQLALFGNAPLAQGQTQTEQEYLAETSPGAYSYQNVPTSGALTLITLTDPSTTNTLPVTVSIPIPAQQLLAGAAVMFVGPNKGLAIQTSAAYSTGFVAVPTSATNPNDVFSLFELTNTEPTAGNYSLDVDISEVDQLGFTYTVTSSNAAPYPLATVGTTPNRATFFTAFSNAFQTQNQAFLESMQLGQNSSGQQVRLIAPQTVLGTFEKDGPSLISAAAQGTGGTGGLIAGTAYYYLITAKSATGETMPSANLAYAGGIVNNTSSVVLNWQAYTGIQTAGGQNNAFVLGSSETTGYNIYRGVGQAPDGSGAHPPAISGFQLIGSVAGASSTTFTDTGFAPTAQTPPSNSYGFDPLSTYFTPAINNFFAFYANPSNTFIYTQSPQATGYGNTTFSGHVVTFTPSWSTVPYTALQLTGSGGEFNGVTFNIYDPMFSTNTNNAALPPMPAWLAAVTSPNESPSQMVFGCDGVFATNSVDPNVLSLPNSGDAQKSIGNIENVIVSAFNRGLTTIPANQWVNPLQFSADPTPGAGGALTSGQTYYYEITSVLAAGGETVPTREVAATLAAGQTSVTLNWSAVDPSVASSFNIYRATSSGGEVLIANVPNITPPPTSFVDHGGQAASSVTPPYRFYAPGSTSNLYSAFLHQNSSTNPATGISVNGLVYGYPFDDQGNFSTNIQYPTGNLPTTVTFSINSFGSTSGPVTPPTATTTAGVPFALTFAGRTGETVVFNSSDPRATLPAAYTYTAADHGSHTFILTLYKAGSETVTITGPRGTFSQTAGVNVLPAAAKRIGFAPFPTTQFVATPFAVAVEALDAFGNPVGNVSGVVVLRGPDLASPQTVVMQDGVAVFDIALKRPGRSFLVASSKLGVARSSVLAVSSPSHFYPTYFAVDANKSVPAGQTILLTVLARRPHGVLDRYYYGTVDVYDRNLLLGQGVAFNGVARIAATLPDKPGDVLLVFRDRLKHTLMGRKVVRVTHPRGPRHFAR